MAGWILLGLATVVCGAQAFMVYLTDRDRRGARVWAKASARHAENAVAAARAAECAAAKVLAEGEGDGGG